MTRVDGIIVFIKTSNYNYN